MYKTMLTAWKNIMFYSKYATVGYKEVFLLSKNIRTHSAVNFFATASFTGAHHRRYLALNKTACLKPCRTISTTCIPLAECELTQKRYAVKRGNYSSITDDDLSVFRQVLGESGVVTTDLDSYNTDWLGSVRGESQVLLRPRTTEQVAQVLYHCNKRNLAVCPQGGNTGFVGGSVPVFDEVILSTALMNEIDEVDVLSGVLTCQAGCVLQALDQHLEPYGLMMPLDLGAKGSCHIGGNVSTNAGGLRLLRYGSLQGNVLGVEAVLASGEVLDCLSPLRKDNTGYHLHHLMIGGEGTLGVITKVAILCAKRPQSVNLAFLSLESYSCALATCQRAKSQLGEILSSCEFVDASSMEAVMKNLKLQIPVTKAPCYLLVETSGSNAHHDQLKLESFLEFCLSGGSDLAAVDGTLASEPSRLLRLWELRERIAEALLLEGYVFKYDISLPMTEFYNLVETTRHHLGDAATRVCGYGHIGDGNLHLNVVVPQYDEATESLLEPWIFEETSRLRGSISAEHGLGFKKRNYIHYSKPASAIRLMQQIKKLMDPKGILNPYTCLPDEQY